MTSFVRTNFSTRSLHCFSVFCSVCLSGLSQSLCLSVSVSLSDSLSLYLPPSLSLSLPPSPSLPPPPPPASLPLPSLSYHIFVHTSTIAQPARPKAQKLNKRRKKALTQPGSGAGVRRLGLSLRCLPAIR